MTCRRLDLFGIPIRTVFLVRFLTRPVFGIDFGTTNTRVAYFDGFKVRAVPLVTGKRTLYRILTQIAYCDGEAVAIGADALELGPGKGLPLSKPLKWLLVEDGDLEVEGGKRNRIDIVADFLIRLREQVTKSVPTYPLKRATVTIPVHYPPDARDRLKKAFERAAIEIERFVFEPIAALYAGLIGQPLSGVAAVFDWGGGSLDIATVQIVNNVALTRQVDGWHRGGTHFDRYIAEHAVNDFLHRHKDNPSFHYDRTQVILDLTQAGRAILRKAEDAKRELAKEESTYIDDPSFLHGEPLNFELKRSVLSELIESDLKNSVSRLERAVKASGVTFRTLTRLFFSGGTCLMTAIRDKFAPMFGSRLFSALRLPKTLIDPLAIGGLDDIGNATAIGAALLTAYGSEPVFANAIGVRLAGGDQDRFYPVFNRNSPVTFDKPEELSLFVADAKGGTARLLICDQEDEIRHPSGRLLRAIVVPIDPEERWLKVRLTLDRQLTLRAEAIGVRQISTRPGVEAANGASNWIQALCLGFRLPPLGS